jgi:phenylglyoxylate dehydrogenase epsilon subunit
MRTHYLIAGASHAALAAAHAIRLHDETNQIVMVSRDDALPYSPTVLPYVVSGKSKAGRVFLKNEAYFDSEKVTYLRGAAVVSVSPEKNGVRLENGETIEYEKLLIATGARPAIPPVEGLKQVPFHVLRTLEDAVRLRDALAGAKRAVVLGAGLVGMHAAENLARAGAEVTIVEMRPQVLPGYFDAEGSRIIGRAFAANGVAVRAGRKAVHVSVEGKTVSLRLDDGSVLDAGLLLVATGVEPVTGWLEGSGIEIDRGVLVDETMRASVADVWAAGDVAQARSFYGAAKVLNGILPEAVEQGRIAGMAMAGDPALKSYPGGVPINTCTFFGHQALSVGTDRVPGAEVEKRNGGGRYLKVVLAEGRLQGIFGIDVPFDAGIMWQLILRRADLSAVKARFLAEPRETARLLMSRSWR